MTTVQPPVDRWHNGINAGAAGLEPATPGFVPASTSFFLLSAEKMICGAEDPRNDKWAPLKTALFTVRPELVEGRKLKNQVVTRSWFDRLTTNGEFLEVPK